MTSTRRSLVGIVALAAALILALAAAPTAKGASTAQACPAGGVPSTGFEDIAGSAHEGDIECLAWWGITSGLSEDRYGTEVEITRAQMAAMMDRLLRETGDHPGSAGEPPFDDAAEHPFASEIAVMADLGVARGVSEDAFAPNDPVTRAQMASMIARLLEAGYDEPLDAGPVPFDDISEASAHYDDVGRLFAAGITTGTSAEAFSPRRPVTRGQMASFLMRSVDQLIAAGAVDAPAPEPDPEPAPEPDPEPAPDPAPEPSDGPVLELTYEVPADTRIALPFRGDVDASIDWGDGETSTATGEGVVPHSYTEAGSYTVTIEGILTRFAPLVSFDDDSDYGLEHLVSVDAWDAPLEQAWFSGAEALT